MAVTQSTRIKSLSTRYLGFYKNSVLIILIGVVCFFVFANILSSIESGKFRINNWFVTGYFLFFVYLWIRMNRNVHRVEFVDDFLYVIQKGKETSVATECVA